MLDNIINAYPDATFLKADGFDEAIIGVYDERLVYSVKQVMEILQREMSLEDAREHFEYNVAGSYVGKKTPIWCDDDF